MKNPLISIIICCHNRAHILPLTMESVFSQDYRPVEIIVIDDGSTDNTPELMAKYGDKIQYHWQKNLGITKTRTNACRLSSGAYIAFIDDDDLMPPDRITVLYRALQRYPQAIFATGDYEIIDSQGKLTGQRWLPKVNGQTEEPILFENGQEAVLWPKIPATVHTTLFKKTDGELISWFNEAYRYASEDKDFFARLGQLGHIVYVPKTVSFYRRGHESLTTKNLNVEYEQLLLFMKHYETLKTKNTALKIRLQQRILFTLKNISYHKKKGTNLATEEINIRVKQALILLNYKNTIKYYWYILVKRPLKRLVRRSC